MSAPRRRSSRLRGSNATPGKTFNHASNPLSSLAERDETPTQGAQSNLDSIVSSPVAPRTPATSCVKPSFEELHPSKTHHSTTKEPDSGLRLGFVDIEKNGTDMPSGVTQQTPSKTGISSTFDFKFARPGPQLGPEAQRMMDDLREEALRIKAKIAAEREQEKRNEEESGVGGRKIAQPKGKVGRFSDAHMAEFKKMDSIAGHPSSFRAQPGRLTPAKSSLKRSQSKAKLDDREEIDNTQEKGEMASNTERLENTAPAKRARKGMTDDASSARPVSQGDHAPKTIPPTLNPARSQSNLLTSITTPTKASLARVAAVKQPASQMPTLSKSPSKPSLVGTPQGLAKSTTVSNIGSVPRSQSKTFLRSPGKLDRVKSILRYSSSSKKPSAAHSSIPTLARSPNKPNLEKDLPSLPTTPGLERAKSIKHVNFTPDTINKNVATITNSPSPFKSAIPRSASKINLAAKAHSTTQKVSADSDMKDVEYPSITGLPVLLKESRDVEYPSLAGVHSFPDLPRQPKPEQRPPPSVPGTFTFRSDHTIQFGASPKGFGSSPGQSSVRQVRQSIFPNNTMPGSFPGSTGSNKENKAPLPSVPHGMSNKKRRRVDSDEEEEEVKHSPKKQKSNVPEGDMLMAPRIVAEKMAHASKIPSPAKKKPGLSLSRLNLLARPKNRK